MKPEKTLRGLALLAALLGAGLAQAAGQSVTALMDDSVDVYDARADYFVRSGSLARRDIALPAPVLEASPRGYVRVALPGREVWLDSMDVTLYPAKDSGSSGCTATSKGSQGYVSRGAGEGCR